MGERTSGVVIRPYRSDDASITLAVFRDAITVTAAADYTCEQVAAWARPGARDLAEWDRAMTARNSVVAEARGQVAGFSDLGADGYIHMLFVAPDRGRSSIGRMLLAFVERRAHELGIRRLWADVSLTARPLFERVGFHVEAEQQRTLAGITMTNFRMCKDLAMEGRGSDSAEPGGRRSPQIYAERESDA